MFLLHELIILFFFQMAFHRQHWNPLHHSIAISHLIPQSSLVTKAAYPCLTTKKRKLVSPGAWKTISWLTMRKWAFANWAASWESWWWDFRFHFWFSSRAFSIRRLNFQFRFRQVKKCSFCRNACFDFLIDYIMNVKSVFIPRENEGI